MRICIRAVPLVVVCALMLVPSGVLAQQVKDPSQIGTHVPTEGCTQIADDAYNGSIGSMACVSVPGVSGTIIDMDLDLGVDHTWAGDLVLKVVNPSAQVLTVFSRPGLAEPVDDGTGCCGDSSDLTSAAPLDFADANLDDPETMGSTIGGAAFICQSDGRCTYFANPDSGPGTNFAQFAGQSAAGTWQVCVGDAAGGDTGQICQADLNFNVAVPTVPRGGLAALLVVLIVSSLLLLRRRPATR